MVVCLYVKETEIETETESLSTYSFIYDYLWVVKLGVIFYRLLKLSVCSLFSIVHMYHTLLNKLLKALGRKNAKIV